MKSCHAAAESDKIPAEIRPKTFDSPGCSLTSRLPDPWLFDSAALIREIDRIRETALQVPTNGDTNATHFGLQQVINAAWTLRENLRYLLKLHGEAQRSFRKRYKGYVRIESDNIWGMYLVASKLCVTVLL